MPVFVAAYGAIVAIPTYYASQGDREPAVYGVVDPGGLLAVRGDVRVARGQVPQDVRRTFESAGQGAALDQAMGGAIYVFRPYVDESTARADLTDRKITRSKGTLSSPQTTSRAASSMCIRRTT
jgi:hypothetical protein